MLNDFSTEYSELTDDEILHIAAERRSLKPEAALALDAELRRRHLSASDQLELQKFVKRQQHREFRNRHRKRFGKRDAFTWRQALLAFAVMAPIMVAYFALPKRYHLKPSWEEAAADAIIVSVIVIIGRRSLWRDILFWIALLLSSTIQLVLVHSWVEREGPPSRGAGKGALILALILFFVIYGGLRLIRRNFYGETTAH